MPSHSSALRRSISLSWRLRHAFGVFCGKCLAAIGCQFSPEARALISVSSSAVLQVDAGRGGEDEAAAAVSMG